jgi:hypothetical protein
MSAPLHDAELSAMVREAVAELPATLGATAPRAARKVDEWMRGLSRTGEPADYFLNRERYPMLLLPWWAARQLGVTDRAFLRDVTASTVSGYYFIRLVDDITDGHATTEPELLPAAAYFHSRFQGAYQAHPALGAPFHDYLQRHWWAGIEAAVRERESPHLTEAGFGAIAMGKLSGAKIPIAAVCHRAGRADALPAWEEACDLMALAEQMLDDVFDWRDDADAERTTFFLSEGHRRRRPDEELLAWVAREGFTWGTDWARDRVTQLAACGRRMGVPELSAYADAREAFVSEHRAALAPGLAALTLLADSMR